MNRRPLHVRVATLALAALFVIGQLVDGSGVHRCPMHDGVLSATAAVAHGTSLHHSGHGGSGDAPHSHGACTCLGACQSGSVALAAAPASAPAAAVPAPIAALAATGDRLPDSPAHLLPFAIGPPLLG